MRVKFEQEGYRWLAVRERPDKVAPIARKIERGCEFDVDDTGDVVGADIEGNVWYHISGDDPGYVMAEFVTPLEEQTDDAALKKMTVPELRKLAEESGVTLKPGMKKADIIKALLNG